MVIDTVLLFINFCTLLLYCICVGWTWLFVCTCVVLGVVFVLLCAFAVTVFAYVGKQKCVQVRGVQLNVEPIHGLCSPVIAALCVVSDDAAPSALLSSMFNSVYIPCQKW